MMVSVALLFVIVWINSQLGKILPSLSVCQPAVPT